MPPALIRARALSHRDADALCLPASLAAAIHRAIRRQTNRFALYDYWALPDWTHDELIFDFKGVTSKLRYGRANNIEAVNAQTS